MKDEEIKHDWPVVDSMPKVSHVEPHFKSAATGAFNPDLQVDFSTIEQKELPKRKDVLAGELTGENFKIGQQEPGSPTEETDKSKSTSLNPEGSNLSE